MGIELHKIQTLKNPAQSKEKSKAAFDLLSRDIKLFGPSFGDKKKERFYSELSILMEAGVDIRSALELIEGEQEKENDRALFSRIKDAVVAGNSLSAAMEQTGLFSPYEYFSLKIGEESGRITDVLKELSGFFAKKIKQKRLLTSALSYPTVVFFASFGAMFFMMKFVVPMFSDVFKRFKGELPYFTRLLIKVSDAVSAYSLLILLLMLGSGIFIYSQRRKTWFRKYGAKAVLRIPVMKTMISKIYLARFCQSMNLLISAKTPLVTAIDLVSKMVDFYPIESSLVIIKENIMQGQSLHSSLSQFPVYNKRMISLIKVAEEVNQLDTMFGTLSKQYTDEVEHQTNILGSLIEPAMIIFLGALIAVILIAMYLPLFQMGSAIG